MSASGPPAAGCSPAIFYLAAETAGPEEREQVIEVEESMPDNLRVRRANDRSVLCLDFGGAWAARRLVAFIMMDLSRRVEVR